MIEKKKKQYIKPMIAFEDMQLNSAIADMCTWITVADCVSGVDGIPPTFSPYDGVTYFTANQTTCQWKSICYHNPEKNASDLLVGLST